VLDALFLKIRGFVHTDCLKLKQTPLGVDFEGVNQYMLETLFFLITTFSSSANAQGYSSSYPYMDMNPQPESGECKIDLGACEAEASGTAATNVFRTEQRPKVVVNLKEKCLCIRPSPAEIGLGSAPKCFLINIGLMGPDMTHSGIGKPHPANGAKYQTKPGAGNNEYDKDAIAMGISENDAVGKWIHKTRGCNDIGGRQATKGYIAVPCKHWMDVKAALLPEVVDGQNTEPPPSFAVCGSNAKGTTNTATHDKVADPVKDDEHDDDETAKLPAPATTKDLFTPVEGMQATPLGSAPR
jgi:hypothetical protein